MTEDSGLYFDVIVVGGGNAAMCAALSAREKGARVLLMEKASPGERGGNCPYTGGGFRFTHNGAEDLRPLLADASVLVGLEDSISPYTASDYRREMLEKTAGRTDADLLETLIAQSYPTVRWMREQGIEFELSGRGARVMPGVRVGASAVGSGPGLIVMHYTAARRHGVEVVYETKMLSLLTDSSGSVKGVLAEDSEGVQEIRTGGVVLACGGFEASSEMRSEHLGRHWAQAKVRGSRHNTGDGHRAALQVGAKMAGQWTGYHGTPIDADAPATGSPDSVDRLPRRSYPFGVMVNVNGERFVDEGADFALNNFVEIGALILKQPQGIAYQVFDTKVESLLEERYGSAAVLSADTIEELAEGLGLDSTKFEETIGGFNGVVREGEFDPSRLDGKGTRCIEPPKSNWAQAIDTPPYSAYRVTGGITYTFGGLRIDTGARVLDEEERPIRGLYAAGEIVGGFFYFDSLRASGLMHGAVFGRIAGANAAGG